MGLDTVLEFEKYCVVDGSPNTVLPSPRHRSRVERRTKVKPKCGNEILSLNKNFTEISFHRYRSVSCRSVPSKTAGLEGSEVLKRNSVYRSSKEVRKFKKIGAVEERRKIEFSRNSATGLSFGIVDSLCSSDEDSSTIEQKRSSVMSLNSDLSSTSLSNPGVSPLSDGNALRERDPVLALQKSLSDKLESDCSRASSPKSRFSPIRKIFDPFIKSKSQRSPVGSPIELGELTPIGLVGISRNKTFRKSLLHDFSNTVQSTECDTHCVKKEHHSSLMPSSPAHLHSLLKLENKHGVPSFEFLVKSPEDVFVAKTWKVENSSNWVYTFHSMNHKRKSNARGWGLKDNNKESSMVGQMQVSCHLCTELKDSGAFDNSMLTEFVLYDIAQARKSVADQDNSNCSPDVAKTPKVSNENSSAKTCELDEVSNPMKVKGQVKHAFDDCRFNSSTPHPWAAAELHPNLQIAAIVIQVPFEKRESLKCKNGDRKKDQPLSNLLDLSKVEQRKKITPDCLSPAKVNVVTPSGNHSLPSTKNPGPSPLLDRWRLGGGCDCGGWDMACPLNVFGNRTIQSAEDHLLVENQLHSELFVQGRNENTPALTITIIDDGQYAVDFHAQLSALQAFSICVAILHTTEASIALGGQENNRQLLQCDSLRVFIEEDVKYLNEAVTEEEKRKVNKKMEPASFVLNPPFSPIGRV